jgi:Ca2+-binding RTX toxin-like protein
VSLSDDDLGTAESWTTALVTGARVKDGELQVVGTHGNDWVEINEACRKLYKVHTDFLLGRCHYLTFNAADVESIRILLGDGNDHASIAGNIDLPVTIDGGAGNDHLNAGRGPTLLIGGEGSDKLIGSRGDDQIYGGGGNDFILGGGGYDLLDGGSENDKILGSCGNDEILGGDGNDRLYGGSGDDVLDGGPGDDRLFGERGEDQLLGGEGNDLLVGGPGKDTLDGGPGKDKLIDWTCKSAKSQSCHDVKTPPCSSWVKSFVTDQCGDLGKNRPNEQIKIVLPALETARQGSGNRADKR